MSYQLGDRIRLAVPRGREDAARRFYRTLLGVDDDEPWDEPAAGSGEIVGHTARIELTEGGSLGTGEAAERPLRVADREAAAARCWDAGGTVLPDDSRPGVLRLFIEDPFGNRLELVGAEG